MQMTCLDTRKQIRLLESKSWIETAVDGIKHKNAVKDVIPELEISWQSERLNGSSTNSPALRWKSRKRSQARDIIITKPRRSTD